MKAVIVLAVLGLVVAGCAKDNSNYCPDLNDNDNCREGDTRPCSDDSQCPTDKRVCSMAADQGVCVQCTATRTEACTGSTPICGGDSSCRGCESHAECPDSDVCLPDGSCAAASDVAYVAQGGTGDRPCARGAACPTLKLGIEAERRYVKVTGAVTSDSETVIDNREVTIVAAPGAKLSRSTAGRVLVVRSELARVIVHGLEISGQIGLTFEAVFLDSNGGRPQLTLERVTVSGGQGRGVVTNGGLLTLSRSLVSGNLNGGISVSNGEFDITNTFVLSNGSPTSLNAGVRFNDISAGTRRFEFNTVSNNSTSPGQTAGVLCTVVAPPVAFSNNIVYGNVVGAGGVQVRDCTWAYSDIGPDANVGGTNIDSNPRFVDPASGKFGIQSGSPAQDAADPDATLGVDFDGDARPQGPRRDMGADEVR